MVTVFPQDFSRTTGRLGPNILKTMKHQVVKFANVPLNNVRHKGADT